MMESWERRTSEISLADALARELHIGTLEAGLLVARGMTSAAEAARFLNPSEAHLDDPFLFSEMESAVAILEEALAAGKRILIHGDYDADGICGTALLYRALSSVGKDVHYFVPDRARDGYGLSRRMMERGVESGMDLVVSVDCGSSDSEIVSFLASSGVGTIITDHHEIEERIPDAGAFLNPKLPGERYPFKELAGVGVAYKLLQGLRQRAGLDIDLEGMLDLVALGTLGDYALLEGENRTLVSLGLKALAQWTSPGLSALRSVCGMQVEGFNARQICFTIVPRLNSPGRVGSARDVVRLLTTEDPDEASAIAAAMEEKNTRRKSLDAVVTEEASYLADVVIKRNDPNALVFSSASWHEGVVGIGAARLTEKYGLPAVLIAVKDGIGKGSARSARSVNIKEALGRCSSLLEAFGGHKEAGGFSIREDRISDFSSKFDAVVGEMISGSGENGSIEYDAEVGLPQCTMELLSFIDGMEPFGPGNRQPLFLIRSLKVRPESRIVGNGHLKISAEDPGGKKADLIGFSLARAWNPADIIGRELDVLANLRRNSWQGKEELQLEVQMIRYSEKGVNVP